jgi:enoyl-[acyl-carrier protein] reductase I
MRVNGRSASGDRAAQAVEPTDGRGVAAAAAASQSRQVQSGRLVRAAESPAPNGLLAGKKALVFGVANDHSIAWGIAKALHDEGAQVGFSSMPSLIKRRVRPLANSIGSHFVEGCDVRDDDEIRRVFERWTAKEGQLDILVHAVAYAEKEDLAGRFADTSRDGFHTAFDISVYSLIAMGREARSIMPPGSSIMTMTYYGAEKVVPRYNVMGVAKAALEASTRYLAADLGPAGIRINAISAGPVRTLSAHGIAGFRMMYGAFAEVTPLRSHITIEDVAGTAVYLASPLSGQTTGEVIYVDGGFNILGLPVAEE